jgi:hypothetical protein
MKPTQRLPLKLRDPHQVFVGSEVVSHGTAGVVLPRPIADQVVDHDFHILMGG